MAPLHLAVAAILAFALHGAHAYDGLATYYGSSGQWECGCIKPGGETDAYCTGGLKHVFRAGQTCSGQGSAPTTEGEPYTFLPPPPSRYQCVRVQRQ